MGRSKASARATSADAFDSPWWTVPPPGQDAKVSFGEIWQRYSAEILAGKSRVDVGAGIPIYSLISRLPAGVAEGALAALSRDRARWEPHHRYPPAAVHTTILLLSPYLGIGPDTDEEDCARRVAAACDPIGEALSATSPLRVRARGLNLFSSTVFLQLLPRTPAAPAAMRHRLAAGLRKAFPQASAEGYEGALPWDLLWANLIRFRAAASPALVDAVAARRDLDLGEIRLDSLELVRTDRLLSEPGTRVLARFRLAG